MKAVFKSQAEAEIGKVSMKFLHEIPAIHNVKGKLIWRVPEH